MSMLEQLRAEEKAFALAREQAEIEQQYKLMVENLKASLDSMLIQHIEWSDADSSDKDAIAITITGVYR